MTDQRRNNSGDDIRRAVESLPPEGREQIAMLDTMLNFLDGLNDGDPWLARRRLSPDATFVDVVAPFLWQGDAACSRWLAARRSEGCEAAGTRYAFQGGFEAAFEKRRAHLTVALVPTAEDSKVAVGPPIQLTLALRKRGPGWLIDAATLSPSLAASDDFPTSFHVQTLQ